MENTTVKIRGIKCDNPNCTFVDSSVSFESYEEYIDMPCPLCGDNLLTRKDYQTCKRLIKLTNFINKFNLGKNTDTKSVSISLNMDGTGKVKIGEVKQVQ